jgi:urease accessory protein
MQLIQLTTYLPQTHARGGLSVTLPFEQRCKSRLRATLSNGSEAAVLLPRGTVLRGGDALASSDGTQVQVIAEPEAVLYATATDAKDTLTLLKGAYHLGNRHTPVELGANYVAILFDPVLADLLVLLGLAVQPAIRPFEPEHGAYGGGHKHGHDETFNEDYALAQASFEHHHGHHHGDGVVHSHG